MNIEYASKSIKRILEDQRLIVKNYGDISRNLILRMSDLRVASNLNEISHLPPPRRHKLTSNFKGCWGIDLSRNKRLIIRPIGDFDSNDLTSITAIRIEDITDYHER